MSFVFHNTSTFSSLISRTRRLKSPGFSWKAYWFRSCLHVSVLHHKLTCIIISNRIFLNLESGSLVCMSDRYCKSSGDFLVPSSSNSSGPAKGNTNLGRISTFVPFSSNLDKDFGLSKILLHLCKMVYVYDMNEFKRFSSFRKISLTFFYTWTWVNSLVSHNWSVMSRNEPLMRLLTLRVKYRPAF